MKLRPILIFLLFVGSVALLMWVYYATANGEPMRKQKLWSATIDDLNVYSRRQHAKSVQYDHFAIVAQQEGDPQAATLFRALAFADRLSEHNCVEAITHLGGRYQPPQRVVVFRGVTDQNLIRSIAYEQQIADREYHALISRALADGNRYAARVLIWAASADRAHVALMRAIRCNAQRLVATQFLVCPQCANTYSALDCDIFCPHCLTQSERFVRF